MKHHRTIPLHLVALFALALPLFCHSSHAQTLDVQAQIEVMHPGAHKSSAHGTPPDVVLWLHPLTPAVRDADPVVPGHFRMAQKNKSFHPHLLVIPLGSTVAFPNLDPFFHNVFSQFNGKRFDLGLYEAGSTRDVHFDHEGVSFIFCNIHPEMSAVIITLDTPWYAISSGGGPVVLHKLPPGSYELHVWAEGAATKELDSLTRRVHISPEHTDLGVIAVRASGTPPPHKNKFGEDYRPDSSSPY